MSPRRAASGDVAAAARHAPTRLLDEGGVTTDLLRRYGRSPCGTRLQDHALHTANSDSPAFLAGIAIVLRFAILGVTIPSVRAWCVACALVCLWIVGGADGQDASRAWSPSIPKTWDDDALRSTELPLARPDVSPAYVSSDYYYRMPIRPIYKSYPVYRPDREPAGYFNRLAQQEPEIVFDERTLRTEQAWTDAGRVVFSAPIEFESSGQLYSGVRDMHWYERNHVPVARDGVLPFMQYIVRQKGKVELGVLS